MPANKDGYRPTPRRYQVRSMALHRKWPLGLDSDTEEMEFEVPTDSEEEECQFLLQRWKDNVEYRISAFVDIEKLANAIGSLAEDFDLTVNHCRKELDSIQNGDVRISEVDQEDSFPAAEVQSEGVCHLPVKVTSDNDEVIDHIIMSPKSKPILSKQKDQSQKIADPCFPKCCSVPELRNNLLEKFPDEKGGDEVIEYITSPAMRYIQMKIFDMVSYAAKSWTGNDRKAKNDQNMKQLEESAKESDE